MAKKKKNNEEGFDLETLTKSMQALEDELIKGYEDEDEEEEEIEKSGDLPENANGGISTEGETLDEKKANKKSKGKVEKKMAKSMTDDMDDESQAAVNVSSFLAAVQASNVDLTNTVNDLSKSLSSLEDRVLSRDDETLRKGVSQIGRGLVGAIERLDTMETNMNTFLSALRLPVRDRPKSELVKGDTQERFDGANQPSISKSQQAAIIGDLEMQGKVPLGASVDFEFSSRMSSETAQLVTAEAKRRFGL